MYLCHSILITIIIFYIMIYELLPFWMSILGERRWMQSKSFRKDCWDYTNGSTCWIYIFDIDQLSNCWRRRSILLFLQTTTGKETEWYIEIWFYIWASTNIFNRDHELFPVEEFFDQFGLHITALFKWYRRI